MSSKADFTLVCRSCIVVPAGTGEVLVLFKPTRKTIQWATRVDIRDTLHRLSVKDGPNNDRASFTCEQLRGIVSVKYKSREDCLVIQTIEPGI
jgi:hypothetical protein